MRKAAVYARISDDKQGKALGVQRQIEDCQQLVTRKGWREIVPTYIDNDLSATRSKTRPAYERLLQDMAGGKVEAVVVYALDRLHRRPAELEQFIDLANRHDVLLASVSGAHDLATSEGRGYARMLGVVGAMEAEKISERVRRKQQQLRDEGKPFGGGRRPYGYDVNRMKVVKHEAKILREIAARLIEGEPLRFIVTDLNRRGVRPARADRWTTTTLRAVISKPRNAGLLTYKGDVIGEAAWPAILTRETFDQVLVALDKRRPSHRMVGTKYLLSGLARCGVCGARLQIGHQAKGAVAYRCPSDRHVTRSVKHLDNHVVRELLARADATAIAEDEYAETEDELLTEEIARLEARKTEAEIEFIDGSIPPGSLRTVLAGLQTRIDALSERRGHTAAVAFDQVLWWRFRLLDDFEFYPLFEKRSAITMYIAKIVVHPAVRRGRGYDESCTKIHFRSSADLPYRVFKAVTD